MEKQLRITYSECVFVAWGIQHAMLVRRIVFSLVAWPALPYFATNVINGAIFGKKKKEKKKKKRSLSTNRAF